MELLLGCDISDNASTHIKILMIINIVQSRFNIMTLLYNMHLITKIVIIIIKS